MADWTTNTIMTWDGNRVTDHGRSSLSETPERIGTDKRMANGTMRRQFITNKRTWTVSWENLPSKNGGAGQFKTADGGWAGSDIEEFYNTTPGAFTLVLKRGSAIGQSTPVVADSALPYEDNDFYIVKVMITDFSKEVLKRGAVDIWNLNITLVEV